MHIEVPLATLLLAPLGDFRISDGDVAKPRRGLVMVGQLGSVSV